ncbi:hypothetical protein IFM89_028024 [Coptis chinensis]|uniref:JAB1/MPN/MOV34 metalloenzyme domain-containing protein n=1 Tax=Coptis chinensis TaxID=261450 RepID=A0A835LMZ9_9MAGN|nr:hypothetical protein IFM89_028024 [Coptis chinensis]
MASASGLYPKQGVIINMASASGLYPMLPDPIYSGSKGAFELIQDERRAGACLWITNRRGMEYWPTPTEETKYRTKQPNARKVYSNIEKSYIQIPRVIAKAVVHTLSHNFRSATSIVRTLLKLPIEPHHVLLKVIYAGVNASDVSFLIPTSCSGHYFGGSDQELSSRLPFDAGFEVIRFIDLKGGIPAAIMTFGSYSEFMMMVVHARSGGNIEIMGLMQGKTDGEAIIVMDAFALPVEGTETRVNAQVDAYEYMVDYSQTNKQDLSEEYKPPGELFEYRTIPLNKIEDFDELYQEGIFGWALIRSGLRVCGRKGTAREVTSKQCEDPTSILPSFIGVRYIASVTHIVMILEQSNNYVSRRGPPLKMHLKLSPRLPKRGDILIDINDRFPRDFLSDIFSKERLTEDSSSISLLYNDGTGLSINIGHSFRS